MSEVTTTLRSAYLAGPMRGYDEYNFPAFHKQAAWLRSNGWTVFSPAERDMADESIDGSKDAAGWADHLGLDYFMQFDLAAVCTHDAVICLPGWEQSQGARLETMVAVEVGHPVFEITKGGAGIRTLESVSPARIAAEFIAGTRGYEELPTAETYECGLSFYEELRDGCQGDPDPERDSDAVFEPFDQVDAPWDTALPTDSAGRKAVPITSGVLDYFPAALVEVAKVSKAGNDKHNPGQPLHHARSKSTDHADSLLRHLIDRGKIDAETGQRHSAEVAWRALALLQQELEDEGLAPLPRGAREDGQAAVDKIIARMGGERGTGGA
jgi:Domain of unknown function (DUF4406)/dATP/dGTP diphosphohydrolase, N-terminal